MIEMEQQGLYSAAWSKAKCGDLGWGRPCEYLGAHESETSTLDDSEFFEPPDYRQIVNIEGVL